jgi:predicted O-methyltransferase YrrM
MSSLLQFRANMRRAGLEDTVIPALSPSQNVARLPLAAPAFVFIDGGHSMPAALADYQNWGVRVMKGGLLAIHDVFPNPADGGRPPHEIYKLALHSGLFKEEKAVKSLRILRRL